MLKKYYTVEEFVRENDLILSGARILNAGSSSIRFGQNCLNVDIQEKDNVDLVADLHYLPDNIGKFDAVICNAVLQYCRSPATVIEQFKKVLNPGGLLFIDAPWVQPYCDDTADLFRFSEQGLLALLEDFEIISSGPSITPGSAWVMQGSYMAGSMSSNKYVRFALTKFAETVLYPMHWVNTNRPEQTAGANFAVARNVERNTARNVERNTAPAKLGKTTQQSSISEEGLPG